MASWKAVEFSYVRRCKKNKKQNKTKKEQEIKPIFMVLWNNAFNASVIYNIEVLEHFVTRNYLQRLVIVQNSL